MFYVPIIFLKYSNFHSCLITIYDLTFKNTFKMYSTDILFKCHLIARVASKSFKIPITKTNIGVVLKYYGRVSLKHT